MRTRQAQQSFSMVAYAACTLFVTFLYLSGPRGCSAAFTRKEKEAAQRLADVIERALETDHEITRDEVSGDVQLLFGKALLEEESTIPQDTPRNEQGEPIFYGDRLVHDMQETFQDPDCMTRELDASDEKFDAEEAAKIYQKCRLLVVRNLLSADVLKPFKREVASFLLGVQSGRVSSSGSTSFGEPYYTYDTAPGRWEVAFPRELADEKILAHPKILKILRNERVLGERMGLLDFGGILAEPGAQQQTWHQDGEIYGNAFEFTGLGGHDLPPFDVGVAFTLINMTNQHGPTEFCLGTTNLACTADKPLLFKNKTLEAAYERFQDHYFVGACPAEQWRAPLLNFGDVVFFAFDILHRGGANKSPDMRFLVYNTYAQPWFRDSNYAFSDASKLISYAKNGDDKNEQSLTERQKLVQQWLKSSRVAIPDKITPEDPHVTSDRPLDSLEKLGVFHAAEMWKETPSFNRLDAERSVPITNVNVDTTGMILCTKVKKSGKEKCVDFDLKISETASVTMSKGDSFRVLSPSPMGDSGMDGRRTIYYWELKHTPAVDSTQRQLILHTSYLLNGGGASGGAGNSPSDEL